MNERKRDRILDSIGVIATTAKGSKLQDQLYDQLHHELALVADYFHVTPTQALLAAVVFSTSYTEDEVYLNDLMRYFDCSLSQMLRMQDDLSVLLARGILRKSLARNRSDKLDRAHHLFNPRVAEQLYNHQPFSEVPLHVFSDELEFLREIYQMSQRREVEEITTVELFAQAEAMIQSNKRFPLMRWIDDQLFSVSDAYFFLYLIWKRLTGEDGADISVVSSQLFDDPVSQIRFTQQLLFGESRLLRAGWVALEAARFSNDSEVKLTDQAKEQLDSLGIKLRLPDTSRKHMIRPADLASKKMMYNQGERQQIGVISRLLKERNLTRAQRAMRDKGYPTGITVLFHGVSGTGKTETVYQLARQVNREIRQVDISRSRSMWFGESEKNIKRIFDDYREMIKKSSKLPILLFNEADAIISRRKPIGVSSVSQTENSIQNILLEEMERFPGILFATTNLIRNIDEAFDRRFLFKVEFHLPDTISRRQIWKVKLPTLTNAECRQLADLYEFSGGQIDNVARKCEMESMLAGKMLTFETIIKNCDAETLTRRLQQPIGFIQNR